MGNTSVNGTGGTSRLEELRAAKAKRETARENEAAARELEALELEEKYETAGQKMGVDFEIYTNLIGCFAVRKPEFVVAKRFADAETKTVEDVIAFVAPCVMHPEQSAVREVFMAHGGVAWRLAALCMKLYEADAGKRSGK